MLPMPVSSQAPFEALLWSKVQITVCWPKLEDVQTFTGPEMVHEPLKDSGKFVNACKLRVNKEKCLSDESLIIPMKELRLDDKLIFVEEPVEIMDREVKQLKQKANSYMSMYDCKRGPNIYVWDIRENQDCAKYPHLFSNITPVSTSVFKHHSGIQLNLGTRFLLRDGDYNNPQFSSM
ncbi:hypothetical protein Tco_0009063 [Tanacetum coccineum]